MEEAPPLVLWLSALILLGLLLTVRAFVSALLKVFAAGHGGGIIRIITLPISLLERVVTPGLNFVTHELSKAASHYMHPLARFFGGLALWTEQNAIAVGRFAEQTAIGFERMTTMVLPREIGRAVRPVERKAAKALGLAGLTAAALLRLRHRLEHALYHDVLPRLHRLTHAIEVTIPRDFGRVERRVKDVETQLSKPTRAWLRRLMYALLAAGLLGEITKVVAKRFPWLFCRKVKTVGKRICSVDQDLFDWLLAGALIVSGPISLQTFARDAVEATDFFVVALSQLISDLIPEAEDYLGAPSGPIPSGFVDYLD
jgi:hypothetical protein